MDKHESHFRKLDDFFSVKQQTSVYSDQKTYSHLIYYFIYDRIYNFFLPEDFQGRLILRVLFLFLIVYIIQLNCLKCSFSFKSLWYLFCFLMLQSTHLESFQQNLCVEFCFKLSLFCNPTIFTKWTLFKKFLQFSQRRFQICRDKASLTSFQQVAASYS